MIYVIRRTVLTQPSIVFSILLPNYPFIKTNGSYVVWLKLMYREVMPTDLKNDNSAMLRQHQQWQTPALLLHDIPDDFSHKYLQYDPTLRQKKIDKGLCLHSLKIINHYAIIPYANRKNI